MGLLCLLGFLVVGVTSLFTSTAAHTLFLTHNSPSALAYCYLGFAVVMPLVGTCYLRMQARWGLRTIITIVLTVDIVTLLCFRGGLWSGWERSLSFGLKIWYDAELVLTSLVFWGLANQLLTVRQGKRLFGIIGAGDPLALVIGGAAMPFILKWLSPADLLVLSALGSAAAIPVAWVIVGRYEPSPSSTGQADDAAPAERQGVHSFFHDRYVPLIFAAACLSLFCYFLVDNAFYAEAKGHFPAEADLASFLGLYMAVAGVVSLVTAVIVAGPLISRYGVRAGLLALPVLLFLFSVVGTASLGLADGAALLFGCVVANRVIDFAMRGTVDKSSMLAAYQPLSPGRRLRIQTAVETMVEPFAAAVAGLGLLLVMNVFDWRAQELTVVVACLALLWIGTLIFVHRHYLIELGHALATRCLERIVLETGEHTAIVEQGLNSRHAGEVIYCLDLLTSSGRLPPAGRLLSLLDHPSADVRCAVASTLEQRADPALGEPIRSRIGHCHDPRVKSALLSALLASSPDALDEVVPFLDSQGAVRNGAIIALLRHGGIEGVLLAGERLLEAMRSDDPSRREEAALALGAVASPLLNRLLLRLLADSNLSVRRAALRAATQTDGPGVWPIVVAQLDVAGLERPAQNALVAAANRGLPAIDAALARPDLPPRARLRLIEVLSRIGGPNSQSSLLPQLDFEEWRTRLALDAALGRCACQCPSNFHKLLWKRIDTLTGTAAWALAASADLPDEPGHFNSVRRSLNHEIDKAIAAIIHLLTCLHPGRALEDARENLFHGPPDKRAYALEAIEQTIPAVIRVRVMALLEPTSQGERQEKLNRHFPQPSLPLESRLADILSSNERVGPWTAAVTLFAAAKSKIRLPFDRVVLAGRFDDTVVHETLAWMEWQQR